MANENGDVNERVVKKLDIFRPPPELIDGYLDAISAHYKVGWTSGREQTLDGDVPSAEFEAGTEEKVAEGEVEGEQAATTAVETKSTAAEGTSAVAPPPSYEKTKEKPLTDDERLAARFEALKKR